MRIQWYKLLKAMTLSSLTWGLLTQCTIHDKDSKSGSPTQAPTQEANLETTDPVDRFYQGQEDFVANFRENQSERMNQTVPKLSLDDSAAPYQPIDKFTQAFQEYDQKIKAKINPKITEPLSAEPEKVWAQIHDRPERLFEQNYRVEKYLDRLRTSAALSITPWSSDYWPIYKGITSFRYTDITLQRAIQRDLSDDGKINYKKTIYRYAPQPDDYRVLQSFADPAERARLLDNYSPAEKYDLLMGDLNFTLTRQSKEAAIPYLKADGSVETWMGICHGWAPVAYRSPEPLKPVTMVAADGQQITFHPDDIKALAVLKWAQTSTNSHFVGGRCNALDKDIKKDPKTGRVLDDRCFDNNPYSWHVAITNKIGIQNESFVMDATFDMEVWNQPIQSYEVQFFNVKTQKYASSAAAATVSFSELGSADPFAKFRDRANNPEGVPTKVVGVVMNVTYISETSPRHFTTAKPKLVRVAYTYDLELTSDNRIVGGEWYNNNHPDFLWTPMSSSEPKNEIDSKVDGSPLTFSRNIYTMNKAIRRFYEDNGLNNIPTAAGISRKSLAIDGSPLFFIVDGLVNSSSR